MSSIDTKLGQQEALRRIHKILELMNKHLKEHALHNIFYKVTSDIHILGDEHHLKAMLSKFDNASLKQFYVDARNLGHIAKTHPDYIPHIKNSLKQIEDLLREMRKAQILEIRKARFLGRMANHLSKEVRGIEREVQKTRDEIAKHINNFHRAHLK
jgi:vacuolar-type H+-ATPase subunit I/STV1